MSHRNNEHAAPANKLTPEPLSRSQTFQYKHIFCASGRSFKMSIWLHRLLKPLSQSPCLSLSTICTRETTENVCWDDSVHTLLRAEIELASGLENVCLLQSSLPIRNHTLSWAVMRTRTSTSGFFSRKFTWELSCGGYGIIIGEREKRQMAKN